MQNTFTQAGLRRSDFCLLGLVCLAFFGFSLVGGRALTMHEAVLPQSAREMLRDGDWMIPKSGGRPWLERPPLPQWITIALAAPFGRCDQEWIVRIGPALAGTWTVLVVAWIAGLVLGRAVGLVSGLCLATMYEFCRYAWLAEQDIFLAALVASAVACFAWQELVALPPGESRSYGLLGRRPWTIVLLFALLGMTNLAKGLVFGPVMALMPMAAFVAWNGDWSRVKCYLWPWGWLLALVIAGVWPVAAYLRYPDVLDLWHYDLVGRLTGDYTEINRPWWYYLGVLPWAMAPWTPLALLGLWITRTRALGVRYSPERLLWCWALLPPLVFSFASGKHHHYMLHCLAPWGMLAALGMARVGEWVAGRWHRPELLPRLAGAGFAGVMLLYCLGHVVAGRHFDECRFDARFLREVARSADPSEPIYVCEDARLLDPFRLLFYLPENTRLLHNASFLRDEAITAPAVTIVTRRKEIENLAQMGVVEARQESAYSRRARDPGDKLVLVRLTFHPNLARYPGQARISPMQAQGRETGPFLGPL